MGEYKHFKDGIGEFGAYLGVPNKYYHDMLDYCSSTQLKYLYSNSPFHFKARYIEKIITVPATSDAMLLGSAVHSLCLTPKEFDGEFFTMPACDLRTKVGKAIKAKALDAAGGKSLLSESMYKQARGISKSVFGSAAAAKLLAPGFDPEVTFLWECPLTGLKMRAKADGVRVSGKHLIEFKTTRSANPEQFQRQAYNLHYELSAAHYLEGARRCGFDVEDMYFITAETTEPYAVQCYKASDEFLQVGHDKWLDATRMLASGLEKGEWPGYIDEDSEEYPLLMPPKWATVNTDIDMEEIG